MNDKDQALLEFLIFSPLIIIFSVFLSACSPFEIKETEKIAEEVIEDVSNEALQEVKNWN